MSSDWGAASSLGLCIDGMTAEIGGDGIQSACAIA
jgi:hypothetical protein